MDFPMARCTDTNHGGVPPPPRAMVPFILCEKQNHVSSDRLDIISVITPTSVQQGLAWGTAAGPLTTATHANVCLA